MSPDLTLYVDSRMTSPYALAVFVALRHKQLPFALRNIDLAQAEQKTAEFAALSGTQRVPTLVHGDFALSESSAICEYLDEVFPAQPVLPADVRERARVRQVQAWIRSDLMPIRLERSTETLFAGAPCPGPLSEPAQAAARKLIAMAGQLLPQGQDFVAGTSWSIADVDLGIMLNRLVRNGDTVPARLQTYAEKQWAHPAIQEWAHHAARRL